MAAPEGSLAKQPVRRVPKLKPVDFPMLGAALAAGWQDFLKAPAFGLFFGGFYALGGIVMVLLTFWLGQIYMVIPLVIGFILIGPFVAVGLYEVSRALSEGRPLTWSGVLGVMLRQRSREFGWMSFVTLFVFWIWIYQIRLWMALFFGLQTATTWQAFFNMVLTTPNGWTFLAVGSAVGLALTLGLFSITVISFPLLLDRDVDFITAMLTSLETVASNPIPMLAWGIFIAVIAILAMVPAFLGLLIVLPVLGHATWHLYRAVLPAG